MTRSQQVEAATIEGEPVRKWIHERVTAAAQEAARNRVEVEKYPVSLQSSARNFHCVNPGGSQLTQKPTGKTQCCNTE